MVVWILQFEQSQRGYDCNLDMEERKAYPRSGEAQLADESPRRTLQLSVDRAPATVSQWLQ